MPPGQAGSYLADGLGVLAAQRRVPGAKEGREEEESGKHLLVEEQNWFRFQNKWS
jgi:hypothetical protein